MFTIHRFPSLRALIFNPFFQMAWVAMTFYTAMQATTSFRPPPPALLIVLSIGAAFYIVRWLDRLYWITMRSLRWARRAIR